MANVAIMGYGTLGSGLAEVAHVNRESIAAKLGEEVYVKYILDIRDFENNPFADRMIEDFSVIENDPEVEVVVECIGGTKVAQEFTRRALMAGKHVVTANKELVATYGKDLLAIAKEHDLLVTCGGDYHADVPYRPRCGMVLPSTVTDSDTLRDYLLSENEKTLCVHEIDADTPITVRVK